MPPTKVRFIRIDDELWAAAQARALAEQTTVSEVVRAYLDGYASESPSLYMEIGRIIKALRTIRKRLATGDEK
jgi:hypothetical protein